MYLFGTIITRFLILCSIFTISNFTYAHMCTCLVLNALYHLLFERLKHVANDATITNTTNARFAIIAIAAQPPSKTHLNSGLHSSCRSYILRSIIDY
jgi:hypothetical protein